MNADLIIIYKKDSFDIKIEIYYQTIKIITKDKYNKRQLLNKFYNTSRHVMRIDMIRLDCQA